jgi:PAS domain S-box-containing protein
MAKKPRREEDHLFLNSILDNIPHMIFVKDARDLRFVRFNKAGEKLLGRKKEALIGKNDYDFFPKKEADFFTRKDRAVLRSKKLVDIPAEPIHTRTQGTRILHTKKIPILNASGRPQYLLGISEDITELNKERVAELSQINETLRENEERYRVVLAALVEGVIVIDAKGKILAANPGAEKILGFKARDLVGGSAFDPRWGVLSEDGAPNVPEKFFITASLRTGKAFANIVIGLHRADGQLIWLNGNTQPLFRAGEKRPYAVVTSFFDMSIRKTMEAEIQKLNSELELKVEQRTSELKSAVNELEAFSYSVSHDLRAPLRAIEGFSQILLEDHAESLNEEGRRLFEVVRKNTLQMSKLIDDLLAFSRIARKDFIKRRVPMGDLAKLIADELQQNKQGSRCQVTIRAIPDVEGDAPLLRQVWTNLISNAIKFSRPTPSPVIEIGANAALEGTTYYIRDNGVGFDMQFSNKLFGVFQRLHSVEEFEGTGVGLAIVQRIVVKHGGKVWAEGRVNEGATFYFCLPSLESDRR